MAYSNGIITAPVSIDDIGLALGSSSKDVATLVGSPLVNPWARLKPVSRNDLFYNFDDIANNDASLASRQEDSANIDFYQFNFKIPAGTWNTANSLFGKKFNAVSVKYPYPFRMGDFKGYKPASAAPSANITVSGGELYYNMPSEVALSIIEGTGIKVSDFALKFMDSSSVSATSLGTWKIVFLVFVGSTVLLVNTGQSWNNALSYGGLYKSIGASYLSSYNGLTANIIACLCGDAIPDDVTVLSGSNYLSDRFIPLNFSAFSAQISTVNITAFNWFKGLSVSIQINSKPISQHPYYGVYYAVIHATSPNFDETQCVFHFIPRIVKSDGTTVTGNTYSSSSFVLADCYNETTKYTFQIKTPANGNTWVGFTGLIAWDSSYHFYVDTYLYTGPNNTERGLISTVDLTTQINNLS